MQCFVKKKERSVFFPLSFFLSFFDKMHPLLTPIGHTIGNREGQGTIGNEKETVRAMG